MFCEIYAHIRDDAAYRCFIIYIIFEYKYKWSGRGMDVQTWLAVGDITSQAAGFVTIIHHPSSTIHHLVEGS